MLVCGMDPDMLFKFCTPKYVCIRCYKLGLMKYSLMALIFFYVVFYNIYYLCSHLEPHHALGYGTITIQHPVDDCDDFDKDCLAKFHNIGTLPYCKQYVKGAKVTDDERRLQGAKKSETAAKKEDTTKKAEEDVIPHPQGDGIETPEQSPQDDTGTIGEKISKPAKCRYFDRHRLQWETGVPSEIFIPTRYTQIKQKINKACYNPELVTTAPKLPGDEKYRCKNAWITEKEDQFYVADVERFTLKFAHSFNSPSIGKFGVSSDYQGIFAVCPDNHPLNVKTDCERVKVPHTSNDMAPEDAEGLLSVDKVGIPSLTGNAMGEDVIEFGDFLRATPVAQAHPSVKTNVLDSRLPADLGHPESSLRDVGGIILLDVNYANNGYSRPGIPGLPAEKFGVKPITYRYRPYFVPTEHNVQYQLVQGSDHSEYRIVDIWYGVTIRMQFNGELVVFTWSKLLSALTTGLVLLATASTLVVYAASYVMPLQEKYNALMYQMSEDMSDYAKLHNKFVKGVANYINPLGLIKSEAWNDLHSASFAGDICHKAIRDDGTPSQEMTNSDIVKMLANNEVRLNRLDAMDTRLIGDGDYKFTIGPNDELIPDEAAKKNRVVLSFLTERMKYYNNTQPKTQ